MMQGVDARLVPARIPLLLCLGALALGASPDASSVEMHRKGAGDPDASGWSTARSAAGRFTVAVPGRFDDFSVKDTARDGAPQTAHVIGAQVKGVRYAAVCVVRADGAVDPDVLSRLARIPGAKTPVAISVGALAGVEVQASHEGNGALMRALRGDGRVYLLTVEFPAGDAAAVLPLARRFMESFKPE